VCRHHLKWLATPAKKKDCFDAILRRKNAVFRFMEVIKPQIKRKKVGTPRFPPSFSQKLDQNMCRRDLVNSNPQKDIKEKKWGRRDSNTDPPVSSLKRKPQQTIASHHCHSKLRLIAPVLERVILARLYYVPVNARISPMLYKYY
jgi:hypothetical protein